MSLSPLTIILKNIICRLSQTFSGREEEYTRKPTYHASTYLEVMSQATNQYIKCDLSANLSNVPLKWQGTRAVWGRAGARTWARAEGWPLACLPFCPGLYLTCPLWVFQTCIQGLSTSFAKATAPNVATLRPGLGRGCIWPASFVVRGRVPWKAPCRPWQWQRILGSWWPRWWSGCWEAARTWYLARSCKSVVRAGPLWPRSEGGAHHVISVSLHHLQYIFLHVNQD